MRSTLGVPLEVLVQGLLVLGLVVGGLGCIKKGGGHSGSVTASVQPSQMEGTWTATVTHSVETTCGEATHDEVSHLVIQQSGDQITITSDVGYTAVGTISGSQVTFVYSFPDGPGTTTSSVTLDFASTLGGDFPLMDTFLGTATYDWSDGTQACDGRDNWAGVRTSEAPVGEGLTGLWNLTLESLSTTCTDDPQEETVTIPVQVVQVGDDVTISIPGLAEISGTVWEGGLQMPVFGEYSQDNFYVVAEGLLDISADQNQVSGPVNYFYTDVDEPSNNCTGVVQWTMVRTVSAIPL